MKSLDETIAYLNQWKKTLEIKISREKNSTQKTKIKNKRNCLNDSIEYLSYYKDLHN